MTTVYIVAVHDYDGSAILGVFDCQKSAQAKKDEMQKYLGSRRSDNPEIFGPLHYAACNWADADIEPWEVQE